jgi:hypothetical protein
LSKEIKERGQSAISLLSDRLDSIYKEIRALERKVNWHKDRAGSGGSWKRADEYAEKCERLREEMRSVTDQLNAEFEAKKARDQEAQLAQQRVEEAERLMKPRTPVTAKSLKAWGDLQKQGRLEALRQLALGSEMYGMDDWGRSEYRESVYDWFWGGLEAAKSYSEQKAIKVIMENAKGTLEEDVSLEELLKEYWEDDDEA